ncbi:hypothetical protein LTR04_007199 [Oleoguttula sp. CCFEE 6159]|nr:hypothetical protein LTR04_007199 [Oleoguttula sp. CCFEE 6159]
MASTPTLHNGIGMRDHEANNKTENDTIDFDNMDEKEKIELLESDCYDILGYNFPWYKRWGILSVIFMVQISMNLNASMYANGIDRIAQKFKVSLQAARAGQALFLIAYAFGCELWAPWSEEYGRWPVLQISLFFVNLWQIPAALSPNFGGLLVARFLGGLSSAGGSVTLGMVADMWQPIDQQYAVAFVGLSSVAGSVVGPIAGSFVHERYSLIWVFWLQLLVGVFVQIVHFFVPETRVSVLIDREARRRRKLGENVWGPGELAQTKITFEKCIKIWVRPFHMFLTEPIVLCLSLLSGFSDALIFTFLEGFQPVFKQWGFSTIQIGLAFLPLLIGYFIAYISFLPVIYAQTKKRHRDGEDSVLPETRLWWLLYTAPLLSIGLFGFAWTSVGPPNVPWIAPMIFAALIGIANYAIYMATIDYMIASYGPYSSSATGGNGFARDFLAGIAAMYSTPLYTNIPGRPLEYASTILGCIAVMVTIPIYFFYWKGPQIRARSKFAQELAGKRKENDGRRASMASMTV